MIVVVLEEIGCFGGTLKCMNSTEFPDYGFIKVLLCVDYGFIKKRLRSGGVVRPLGVVKLPLGD